MGSLREGIVEDSWIKNHWYNDSKFGLNLFTWHHGSKGGGQEGDWVHLSVFMDNFPPYRQLKCLGVKARIWTKDRYWRKLSFSTPLQLALGSKLLVDTEQYFDCRVGTNKSSIGWGLGGGFVCICTLLVGFVERNEPAFCHPPSPILPSTELNKILL